MRKQPADFFAAAAALWGGWVLLRHADLAANGLRRGLALCGQSLIPSLFPFMVFAVLLSRSRAARPLGRLLAPLCRRVLRLPPKLGPVLLLCLIGGYPVGARVLAGMLDRGEATPAEAEALLSFAICPAPSFAVITVGAGLLGSARAGAVVYGCHLAAGLLLGLWQARRRKIPPAARVESGQVLPFSAALVEATAAGVEGMLAICGTVLAFSAALALGQGLGAFAALGGLAARLSGGTLSANTAEAALCLLAEVTCGLSACRGLSAGALCVLVPFGVSFGSVSVFCQIGALVGGRGIRVGRLMGHQLAHALLCAALAAPLLGRMQPSLAAFAQSARPLLSPAPVVSAAALLGMCSLFLLTLEPLSTASDKEK